MQKIKYKVKDISVVIPTYNRSSEILETLNSIIQGKTKEIIIIDQSKIKQEAKNIEKICNNLHVAGYPVKYYHFDFASTAMAETREWSYQIRHQK